jgi:hypothetical protein
MKRNWMFWIPVQFGVFAFIADEAAQISILIACGLAWTVILSVLAGAANQDKEVVPPLDLPEEEMQRVISSRAAETATAPYVRLNNTAASVLESELSDVAK